jgi:hypothetical protein
VRHRPGQNRLSEIVARTGENCRQIAARARATVSDHDRSGSGRQDQEVAKSVAIGFSLLCLSHSIPVITKAGWNGSQ